MSHAGTPVSGGAQDSTAAAECGTPDDRLGGPHPGRGRVLGIDTPQRGTYIHTYSSASLSGPHTYIHMCVPSLYSVPHQKKRALVEA